MQRVGICDSGRVGPGNPKKAVYGSGFRVGEGQKMELEKRRKLVKIGPKNAPKISPKNVGGLIRRFNSPPVNFDSQNP